MPFPEVPGRVSGLLELAGKSGGLWVEPLGHAPFFIVTAVVEKGGDAPAVRVLSGGEGDTGGRADGRVDVEIGKFDPFLGKAVDVLSFDGATEAGEIRVAHIVDEYDDDVGFG